MCVMEECRETGKWCSANSKVKRQSYNGAFPILGREQIEFALSALKQCNDSKFSVTCVPNDFPPLPWRSQNGKSVISKDSSVRKENKVVSRLSSFKYDSKNEEAKNNCVFQSDFHDMDDSTLLNSGVSPQSTKCKVKKHNSFISDSPGSGCCRTCPSYNKSLSKDRKFNQLAESLPGDKEKSACSSHSLSPISGYRTSLQEAFRKIKFGGDNPSLRYKKKRKLNDLVWSDKEFGAINGICKKLSLLNCHVDSSPEVDTVDGMKFFSFLSLEDLNSYYKLPSAPNKAPSLEHPSRPPTPGSPVPSTSDLSSSPAKSPKKKYKSPSVCATDSDSSEGSAAAPTRCKRKSVSVCSDKSSVLTASQLPPAPLDSPSSLDAVFIGRRIDEFLKDCSLRISLSVRQLDAYYAIQQRRQDPSSVPTLPEACSPKTNSNFPLLTESTVQDALAALRTSRCNPSQTVTKSHYAPNLLSTLVSKVCTKSEHRVPYPSHFGARLRPCKVISDNQKSRSRLSVDSSSSESNWLVTDDQPEGETRFDLEYSCTNARKLCFCRSVPSLDSHEVLDPCDEVERQLRNKVVVNKIVDLNHKFSGKKFSFNVELESKLTVYEVKVELDKMRSRPGSYDSNWLDRVVSVDGISVLPTHRPPLRLHRRVSELLPVTLLLYHLYLNHIYRQKAVALLKTYLLSIKQGDYCLLFLKDVVRLLLNSCGYFVGCDVITRRLVFTLCREGGDVKPVVVGNLSRLLGVPPDSKSSLLIFQKFGHSLVLHSFVRSNCDFSEIFTGTRPELVVPLTSECVRSLAGCAPCVDTGLWQCVDVSHADSDLCVLVPSHGLLLPASLCAEMISELYQNTEECSDVAEMVSFNLTLECRDLKKISLLTILHPKLNNRLLMRIELGGGQELFPARVDVRPSLKWDCECGTPVVERTSKEVAECESVSENCQFLVDTTICGCVLSSYFGPVGSRSWTRSLGETVCMGYPISSFLALFLHHAGVPGIVDQAWFWLPAQSVQASDIVVLPGLPCSVSCSIVWALASASQIYGTPVNFAMDVDDHGMDHVVVNLTLVRMSNAAEMIFMTYWAEEPRNDDQEPQSHSHEEHAYCRALPSAPSPKTLPPSPCLGPQPTSDGDAEQSSDVTTLSLPKCDQFYPFDPIVGTNDSPVDLRSRKCPKVLMRKDDADGRVGKIMLYSVRNKMYRIQRLSPDLVVVFNTCVDSEAEDYYPHCKVFSSYNAALHWMKHRKRREMRVKNVLKRKQFPLIIETTVY